MYTVHTKYIPWHLVPSVVRTKYILSTYTGHSYAPGYAPGKLPKSKPPCLPLRLSVHTECIPSAFTTNLVYTQYGTVLHRYTLCYSTIPPCTACWQYKPPCITVHHPRGLLCTLYMRVYTLPGHGLIMCLSTCTMYTGTS